MTEEREKLVSIRAEVPEKLKAKFKAKCALESKDMRTVLIELINHYVSEESSQ